MKFSKSNISLGYSFLLLIVAIVIFCTTAFFANSVVGEKYAEIDWYRNLSGTKHYINNVTLEIWLSASIPSTVWLLLARLVRSKRTFNPIISSLILLVTLPVAVVLSLLSLILSGDWGSGSNPAYLLLLIVGVAVTLFVLANLMQSIPDFRVRTRTYFMLLVALSSVFCFMILPARNRSLEDVSDKQRHKRAGWYFGNTYSSTYNSIQTCGNFIKYAGKVTRFVPALRSTSCCMQFTENAMAKYTFVFEGKKESGLVEAEIYFKESNLGSPNETSIYIYPKRNNRFLQDQDSRINLSCKLPFVTK